MKLALAAEMKELDRQAIEERKIPSIDLMERAAEGVAEAALALLPDRPGRCRAAVFCGTGNNGGDGIAAGRMLFREGVHVRVFLVGDMEKMTPDALEETRRLSESGVGLEPFDPEDEDQRHWALGSHVLVDALFGVGLSRAIRPGSPFAAAVALMNESRAPVAAADIASGVEADTGRVLGCAVRADRTVTFTLAKVGQLVGDGAVLSGQLIVRDIGIPEDLVRSVVPGTIWTTEERYAAEALPKRKPDGHKGDFGKVLVIGGAVGYTGAPYLAASAAVRSGCGLVYLGVPRSIWAVEAEKCVSAMPFPLPDKRGGISERALAALKEKISSCDVAAIGPGLSRNDSTARLVRALLTWTKKPVVLDADGINALQDHMYVLEARRGRTTILTPHDGEFARLGGKVSGGRMQAARDFAVRYGCTLVLKGHRTITASPEGTVLVNTTGNAGLARGGSGDVLTGLIASFLAQGATAMQAAALAVRVHGMAGDLAAEALTQWAMTPEDVLNGLPEVFARLAEQA